MAGTISIATNVRVTHGGFITSFEPTTLSIVQTNQGVHDTIVTVGTSESDMPIGLIATEGWFAVQNIDPTNYITWGPKSAGAMVAMGVLRPAVAGDGRGSIAIFEMDPAATIRWIANTAPAKVRMFLLEK